MKVHNQKVYGRDLPKSALPQLSILDGSSEEGNRGDDGVDPEKPYFHRIDRPSASKAQRQQVQKPALVQVRVQVRVSLPGQVRVRAWR